MFAGALPPRPPLAWLVPMTLYGCLPGLGLPEALLPGLPRAGEAGGGCLLEDAPQPRARAAPRGRSVGGARGMVAGRGVSSSNALGMVAGRGVSSSTRGAWLLDAA